MKSGFLVIYCTYLLVGVTFSTEDNDTFVPTREWQRVKEGQKVPAGLHYRINLETGEKEAKILEQGEETENPKSSLTVIEDEVANENDSGRPTHEEALKNIPGENFEYTPEQMKEIKSKFRTYEDIKHELKDHLNLDVKTDAEIISSFMKKYDGLKKNTVNPEVIKILDELEYLVHQIDNANNFVDQNGIEKIIIPNIVNQTNSIIRTKALLLLGAVMHNNPKAQISAFERNIIEYLTRLLATSKLGDELSAGTFAIGSLIRKFPLAQKESLTKRGLSVLLDIWTKHIELKVKLKVLILIADLVRESHDVASQQNEPDEKDEEKFRQYQRVGIEKLLDEYEFCPRFEQLMTSSKADLSKCTESMEKVIHSMQLTKDMCFESWSQSGDLRHVILVLKNQVTWLLSAEKDPEKFEFLIELEDGFHRLHQELYVREDYEESDTKRKDEL
ncbi:nucleotide exchange factor Sil1 [Phlebotomus argentipes]|uniref:nucleotide exchange factor Sil1 n=1 Tax=Phlebotomus argentipes TaxID=94469 RepID=UPI002892D40E|nr:nucleotide exchange factor Sil1 [Phlebotomus argentipes]